MKKNFGIHDCEIIFMKDGGLCIVMWIMWIKCDNLKNIQRNFKIEIKGL